MLLHLEINFKMATRSSKKKSKEENETEVNYFAREILELEEDDSMTDIF